MKRILIGIVFVYFFEQSFSCKIDWDDTCKNDVDCCSKNCYRGPAWEFGFCISGTTGPPKFAKCAADYFDKCIINDHCCSKLCNRSPYDQFGTCTPRAAVVPTPPGSVVRACDSDWISKCTSHSQCCSRYCEKGRNKKFGTCKPRATQPPKVDNCVEDWSNQCLKNKDCCTGFCSKNSGYKYGVCIPPASSASPSKPTVYAPPPIAKCQNDWYAQCTNHDQCCSGFCEKQGNLQFGICKPIIQQPEINKCAYNGFNRCLYNEECCSGFCDGYAGQYGVCRQALAPTLSPVSPPYPNPYPPNTKCQNDWFNQCTSNDQCCSGFCEKEGYWQYGVCKPTRAPKKTPTPAQYSPKNQCKYDWFNECVNNNQCCSGFCQKPRNYKYGVCKPVNQNPVTSSRVDRCAPDWSTQCYNHSDCCSRTCKWNQENNYGTCIPAAAVRFQ